MIHRLKDLLARIILVEQLLNYFGYLLQGELKHFHFNIHFLLLVEGISLRLTFSKGTCKD